MYALFRLDSSAAEAGTDLLLRHQLPDDQERTLDAFTGACAEARAFSLQVRVADGNGEVRSVLLLGEPELDGAGAVSAVEGIALELPPAPDRPPRHEDSDRVRALETEVAQLRTAMASRAAIEQAKGILMLLTSCGDQVAFDLLAHISSHTHRKVRDVAMAITASATGRNPLPDDVQAIIRDVCPPVPPMH
ncbi:MAG TPA: ANTAR domain-containing protein [Geodermatophilus sp.]|nr:ANTAR domain-containing protein [Geodermatophilus sp.]